MKKPVKEIYPYCYDSCHYATKQEVNPDFCLAHQRYDVSHINLHSVRKHYGVSYTWDGYLIVSKRFKQFCEEKSYQNVVFYFMPQESDFYFLESLKIIPLFLVQPNILAFHVSKSTERVLSFCKVMAIRVSRSAPVIYGLENCSQKQSFRTKNEKFVNL